MKNDLTDLYLKNAKNIVKCWKRINKLIRKSEVRIRKKIQEETNEMMSDLDKAMKKELDKLDK